MYNVYLPRSQTWGEYTIKTQSICFVRVFKELQEEHGYSCTTQTGAALEGMEVDGIGNTTEGQSRLEAIKEVEEKPITSSDITGDKPKADEVNDQKDEALEQSEYLILCCHLRRLICVIFLHILKIMKHQYMIYKIRKYHKYILRLPTVLWVFMLLTIIANVVL